MKNFEKYGTNFGIIIDYYIRDCKRDRSFCEQCIFKEPCHNSTIDVGEWLFSEYKEPIQLTHDEYVILKNMNKRYKWMRRCNANNLLYVYPSKSKDNNFSGDGISLIIYSHLFSFISLNGEPYSESYSIEQLIADYEKEHQDE